MEKIYIRLLCCFSFPFPSPTLLHILLSLFSHNQYAKQRKRFLLTMDSNWRPSGGDSTAGGGPAAGAERVGNPDWRSQLQPEARHRIVTKMMETLKRHLPVPAPEGLNELQKLAVHLEEEIYSAATSQPDYLRKISLKMLSIETRTQGPQINPASNPNLQNLQNPNLLDQGLGGMQAQTFQSNSTNQTMPAGMTSLAQSLTDMYANAQRLQQNQIPQNQTQQNQIVYQQNQIPQNQTQQNQMVYQQIRQQRLQRFMQQQQQRDFASSRELFFLNTASMDSTARTGPNELAVEEVYQKLKTMKETYFNDLREIYQRLSMKLNQIDPALMGEPKVAEQIEKMKNFKNALERFLNILQLNKSTLQLQVNMKEKLNMYEKQIMNILASHKKTPQQSQQAPAQLSPTELEQLFHQMEKFEI
ncbi:hypothetical protein LUZ60_012215 [Juncus effusus]|nr:hypothetical protein LUZ60_012215 [Juncus effusus]